MKLHHHFRALIIAALCCSAGVQGQGDSLLSIWNNVQHADTLRLAAMHHLAKEVVLFRMPDSAYALAEEQLILARRAGSSKYEGEALNTQGISWAIRGDMDRALRLFEESYEAYKAGGLEAESASALYNIGNVWAKRGEEAKGLDYMQRSLALSIETGNIRGITRCYHGIGRHHESRGEYDKALAFYQKSVEAHKKIDDERGVVTTLIAIGVVYKLQGDQTRAIEVLGEALTKAEAMDDALNMAYCLDNIGNLYVRQGEPERAIEYYTRGLELSRGSSDKEGMMHSQMNLGNSMANLKRVEEAQKYLQRSLNLATELGDDKSAGIILNNLGLLIAEGGGLEEGLAICREGLALKEQAGFTKGLSNSHANIGSILLKMGRYREALTHSQQALELARSAGNLPEVRDAARDLAVIQKHLGRPTEALEMYELFVTLKDSIGREENQRALLRQEYRYSYEKQALADSVAYVKKEAAKNLEIEKRDSDLAKQRIGLVAAGGGILLLLALAVSIRRGKRRSDELLLNILPEEVAEELKAKGAAEAVHIDQVTVLFTDFKGFTAMSEQLSPKDLVNDLHECFSAFDNICEKYRIEKIKTIGDAYMAAGGLPTPNTTHSTDVIKAAFEMRDFIAEGKARKVAAGLPFFEIRIGIHTGPVVAGIVGVKKFQYDIWGDTVNTASRMESSGAVGQVNISEATYELLKTHSEFTFESRGKIEAKGKGEMEMYFVERG